ncbi:porin family protein [Ferrimonas balearica]|uniref:porin family protein n=1 Tax=Ferrimonas balearica TaxID=44012 RepID=UPI001C99BF00|nr:porin family protein [Ferrimonas balearica]MBY5922704.1 porin family protein [Ferrimonas balearica]MBY5995688.1 porin family protein [Ferrimonas balearica]
MKRTLMTLALGAALLAGPAAAELNQGHGYFGGQLNYMTFDTGFGDVNPMALTVLGGYQFNPYLALEGRVGIGMTDDNLEMWSNDVSFELDRYFGGYLVATAPLSDWVAIYGMAGFTDAKVSAKIDSQKGSESDSEFSYGAGLKLYGTENAAFTLEYLVMFDDIDTLNLGFTYRF